MKKRFTIKASTSIDDMLAAFEDKLADLGVESSTTIQSSEAIYGDREVEIYDEDWDDCYEDVGGGFGAPGAVYSLGQIKEEWNSDNEEDPSMASFPDFDSWWDETRSNFLIEC